MKTPRQFYVPDVTHWNWSLISPVFVRLQLSRAEESFKQTELALSSIDEQIAEINKQIKAEWTTASATRMRQFEHQIKALSPEVRRIHFVRKRLVEVMGEMDIHLAHTRRV